MAASPSPSSEKLRNPALGLWANAKNRKESFVQFFMMTGILMLSMRSLGQKYRVNDLREDTTTLRQERDSLSQRMDSIKNSLLHEASLDSSGLFASRLRLLFDQHPSQP